MKKKIIGGIVVFLLLATALPVAGMIELEGTVQAKFLPQWAGIVSPSMNLSEVQEITISTGTNGSVNETLRINIEPILEYERFFMLPRYLFATAFVLQSTFMPFPNIIRGRANKAFLINDPFIGGNNASTEYYLDIPLMYDIGEDTDSETLYLHVFAFGILPGGAYEAKIFPVAYTRVNLEVEYV